MNRVGPMVASILSKRVNLNLEPGQRVRIPDEARHVQFSAHLTDRQHKQLGRWFEGHPDAALRVYGNYGSSIRDVDFLRFYPSLAAFSIDSMYSVFPDLSGLKYLPDGLRSLGLGIPSGAPGRDALSRHASLETLAIAQHRALPEEMSGLKNLKSIFIEGPVADLRTLEALTLVEDLTLRSVSVPNLESILPMTGLKSLDIKLGGIRDLRYIDRFPELTYLEIWMVRGLSDLSFLDRVTSLEELHLESLKNVVSVPSFAPLTRLRSITLQNMKGLLDLASIAEAPKLERLSLVEAKFLAPEAIKPFRGHPTLRDAIFGLGSPRKNARAHELLGMGGAPPPSPWSRA